ncbi:MAG TPA: hypothetical protein VFG19_02750 [Geobacteraceae bacterium]|nr:hypothetical protein [Geobacteraceae bacterium]
MESDVKDNCDFTVKKSLFKGIFSMLLGASGVALFFYVGYDLLYGLSEDLAAGGHATHVVFITIKATALVTAALIMLFMSFLIVLFWSKDTLVTFGEIRKQRSGWVTVSYNGKPYKIFKMVFGLTYLVPINKTGITVMPTYNLIPANPHAFAHAFIRVTTSFATKIIRLAKSHLD